jgi:hypothetical protein
LTLLQLRVGRAHRHRLIMAVHAQQRRNRKTKIETADAAGMFPDSS